jgi:hypothetical protein
LDEKQVNGSDELALWHSDFHYPNIKYDVTGPGFKPKISPVTVAVEHPKGVFRKLTKIVPYRLPDGGFAVMVPYHKANEGILSKQQVFDSLSRRLILPPPSVFEMYSVSSKVNLSFHADGTTQFSGMDGDVISGKDPTTGEFRGLGIMAHPFTKPVRSGPALAIVAWGLEDFEVCELSEDVLLFTQPELRNPYMPWPSNSVCIEFYMPSLRQPLASKGYFPDYRSPIRLWNPNSKLLRTQEMRLIALQSPEVALAVFAMHVPNNQTVRSGFTISSPRDRKSFGLYATYPRTQNITDGSLDFPGGSKRRWMISTKN